VLACLPRDRGVFIARIGRLRAAVGRPSFLLCGAGRPPRAPLQPDQGFHLGHGVANRCVVKFKRGRYAVGRLAPSAIATRQRRRRAPGTADWSPVAVLIIATTP